MTTVRFSRWQGAGNVYVLLDAAELPWPLTPARAIRLCDRRTGLASDGLLIAEPGPDGAPDAPFMRIWNPDGGQAEMCGNGLRMFARWRAARLGTPPAVIHTAAGPRVPTLLDDGRVAVTMGRAAISEPRTLTVDGAAVEYRHVDVGNPHAVIVHAGDPDLADAPVATLGPRIEHDAAFANRTNVEWMAPAGGCAVRMRVWERGVGETWACGSGAVAVAAVAQTVLGLPSPTSVHLPGGTLEIARAADGELTMTGPAEEICSGVLSPVIVAALAA